VAYWTGELWEDALPHIACVDFGNAYPEREVRGGKAYFIGEYVPAGDDYYVVVNDDYAQCVGGDLSDDHELRRSQLAELAECQWCFGSKQALASFLSECAKSEEARQDAFHKSRGS
jgi:hypothetical protein